MNFFDSIFFFILVKMTKKMGAAEREISKNAISFVRGEEKFRQKIRIVSALEKDIFCDG